TTHYVFKQKTAYDVPNSLDFRRVLFRSSMQGGTMTIPSGSVLNLTGANEKQFFTYVLNNSGTVNWGGAGNIHLQNSAQINNLARSEERRVGKEHRFRETECDW